MIRAFVLLALAPAQAGAFSLSFPLDCTLGDTCHIQQFVDRYPGPGHADFTCGTLSYDGHTGTDFALPTLSAMQKGIAVLAAAPGIVTGLRDGMPDISIRDPAAPALDGRECGNGVVLEHPSGWTSQYCHMARGSLRVAKGDTVEAGQELGLVGLSGNTEFPHLHLTLRHNGEVIDPFAAGDIATCGAKDAPSLWSPDLPYIPGGLLGIGLTDHIPEYEALKAGLPLAPVTPSASALVLWAHYFGSQQGDVLTLSVLGPDGGQILSREFTLDRTQAQGFRAVGQRLRGAQWPTGTYELSVTWRRGDALIDAHQSKYTVR